MDKYLKYTKEHNITEFINVIIQPEDDDSYVIHKECDEAYLYRVTVVYLTKQDRSHLNIHITYDNQTVSYPIKEECPYLIKLTEDSLIKMNNKIIIKIDQSDEIPKIGFMALNPLFVEMMYHFEGDIDIIKHYTNMERTIYKKYESHVNNNEKKFIKKLDDEYSNFLKNNPQYNVNNLEAENAVEAYGNILLFLSKTYDESNKKKKYRTQYSMYHSSIIIDFIKRNEELHKEVMNYVKTHK